MMNWTHRVKRNLTIAVLGGVAANAVYFGLLFTTLHGFAVKALGPAIAIVNRFLDPTYSAGRYRYLEEFGVNIVLYVFWIFVILMAIDLLRRLRRQTSE